jgi:two-component system, NarL family, response regulator NreC
MSPAVDREAPRPWIVGEDAPTAAASISLVIADDHVLVRGALRTLLDAEPDIAVVAEADDVSSALRCVQAHRPRVLVLDLNMPGEPSLPAIARFLAHSADTHVLVLTMQSDPAFAREALRAGALGYVLKEAADTELVEAVRVVAQGGSYLHPELSIRTVESHRAHVQQKPRLSTRAENPIEP